MTYDSGSGLMESPVLNGYSDSFFNQYSTGSFVKIKTAEDIDPEKFYKNQYEDFISTKTKIFPIWEVKKEKGRIYKTKKPIGIHIYKEEDIYFAENENLSVCGYGNTKEEALMDFAEHVIYFFEYYRKMGKNELVGEALRLKGIYENLFIEG